MELSSLAANPQSSPRLYSPRFSGRNMHGSRQQVATLTHIGSSPRMWGTPLTQLIDGVGIRFIPTHVGNTTSIFNRAFTPAVHPHACGEHTSCNTAKSNRVFKDQKSTNKFSQNYRQPVLHHFQAKKKRV
jgi:hypothetical protein